MRLVTHLDISRDNIDIFIAALKKAIGGVTASARNTCYIKAL